jgi:hypothetical protein
MSLKLSDSEVFGSFESTFPHLALLLPFVVGKNVGYIGSPFVHLGTETQEWYAIHWRSIVERYVTCIPDLLLRYGADEALCQTYRDITREYLVAL